MLVSERLLSGVEQPEFNPFVYLAQRAASTSFTMVEIGHGGKPAMNDPAFFTTTENHDRHYIGSEVWLRDIYYSQRANMAGFIDAMGNVNATFIDRELDGYLQIEYADEGLSDKIADSWFVGNFDVKTGLGSGVADEVLLGNVLGDPHVAKVDEHIVAFLSEAKHVLKPNGVVVLRETLTPHRTRIDEFLAATGLRSLAKVPFMVDVRQLEQQYNGELFNKHKHPQAFYQFLAHATEAAMVG